MLAIRDQREVSAIQVATQQVATMATQHMQRKQLSCHWQPCEPDCYQQLICLQSFVITNCNRLRAQLPWRGYSNVLPTYWRSSSLTFAHFFNYSAQLIALSIHLYSKETTRYSSFFVFYFWLTLFHFIWLFLSCFSTLFYACINVYTPAQLRAVPVGVSVCVYVCVSVRACCWAGCGAVRSIWLDSKGFERFW